MSPVFARSDAEQRPDHAGRQNVILARMVARNTTQSSYYFAHRNSTVSKYAEINTIMSTAFQRARMVPRKPRPEVFRNCCVNRIKIDSGSWPAARS